MIPDKPDVFEWMNEWMAVGLSFYLIAPRYTLPMCRYSPVGFAHSYGVLPWACDYSRYLLAQNAVLANLCVCSI